MIDELSREDAGEGLIYFAGVAPMFVDGVRYDGRSSPGTMFDVKDDGSCAAARHRYDHPPSEREIAEWVRTGNDFNIGGYR